MRKSVTIICNALFMLALSFIVIKEYTIIQSYHYEISKYFIHLKDNRKHYFYFLYCLLAIFLLRIDFLYLSFTLLLLIYLVRDYKIKLTSRVKRVLMINLILLSIMLITNTLKYVFIVPFLYLLLVHYVSLFLEEIIYLKYLKKAKKKIKGKFVIGVTGSCGKTSSKNLIYEMMITKFNVSKTPKSYNNRVGITKSINEYVSYYDDYFICEYGVDKLKGMDKLLRIVKPNIAIITEIGNQHLLSFKSVDNILKEKIKLIESLDDSGIGIINNDNKFLREYDYKNKNILRYGIDYDGDVNAKNLNLTCRYSEFDLYIKKKFISRVKINLLSKHGVENVLCGICVCLNLDMTIKEILNSIKNISFVSHRLEPKLIEEIEVIDDSFNSNIKGFKEALEVLNKSNKYKIIITPGIIEQGNNQTNISKELAIEMIDKANYVYLVSDNSKLIGKYFDEHKYKNYCYKNSFFEAFNEAKKMDVEKIILIENDLPNIYLK
jgi:UDP-N-acetylmuramoyl-tripeptide--D-alanyl-D-alanine ligase